ncbi:Hypothetical predicted protein [Paramuricea clavata]|uniref:Uncharacterized protein n=1 Tax=Paramuricea clavata TaxID=317549 RepID=A0A7D9IVY6_PARCT|nr:Hypothetical predicted protein [Paramuricea clavata]
MSVFLDQTVFDVNAGKTVPLRKWESAASAVSLTLDLRLLADEFSQELTVGNIHMTTRMKVNSHSLHANDKQVCDDTSHSQQEASATTNAQDIREVHITTVERVSFPYVIPNFPVLTVDLIKVKFVWNGKECQGLINAKEHSNARPVLWQLDSYKPFHKPVEHQPTQPRPSGRDDEETVHCLPFKVIGTCYSSSRQKALERAYDFLHVYNRPVFAKISGRAR